MGASVSAVLLLAIQCLCDDPTHHGGGWTPVLLWLLAMTIGFGLIWLWSLHVLRRRDRALATGGLTPSGPPCCPYCREPLQRLEAAVRCTGCQVAHHVECWHEHGGCTLLGCVREAAARRRDGWLPARG